MNPDLVASVNSLKITSTNPHVNAKLAEGDRLAPLTSGKQLPQKPGGGMITSDADFDEPPPGRLSEAQLLAMFNVLGKPSANLSEVAAQFKLDPQTLSQLVSQYTYVKFTKIKRPFE